jgi:RNA polymerase sigma-70 factor (ECF subfamily)
MPLPADVINTLYRELYSKMVASLAHYFGMANLAFAEDIVQDTFIAAVEHWKDTLPDNPPAWLFRVCRNKAMNALSKKQPASCVLPQFTAEDRAQYELEQLFLDHEIRDNQLRLLFACCHGRLSPKAQVMLILKNLCGLRVEEIARGLAMTDEAVMKTLTRSRQTLADENVVLRVPFLLRSKERLNSVHTAIYLLYNEGYNATAGDVLIRKDVCLEAMRLMRSILDIPEIRSHDSFALMALMCFHTARFDARTGTEGEIIELELQDRSQWDHELIRLGIQYLKNARDKEVSRFVLEASIASVHCWAKTFPETNWRVIKGLYDQLQHIQSSPFIDLNRAVAIFYKEGREPALKSLEQSKHLTWLKNHYLYYATLGKIDQSIPDKESARLNYEKALSLTTLRAEQDFLKKKILQLSE